MGRVLFRTAQPNQRNHEMEEEDNNSPPSPWEQTNTVSVGDGLRSRLNFGFCRSEWLVYVQSA